MSAVEIQKKESSEILQLVTFLIGNEEYAVDILYVQEINRMIQITKVPNSPEFVEGVINLRGRVIPVIDFRTRLGLPKKPHENSTRIIVVDVLGNILGFIVDAVREVLRIPSNITEPPPQLASGIDTEYIKSVGKLEDRLIILIDLDKIFAQPENNENK